VLKLAAHAVPLRAVESLVESGKENGMCVCCNQEYVALIDIAPDLILADSCTYKIDFRDLEFQARIGQGGFGAIFRALYRGREVAVKVNLSKDDNDNEEYRILRNEVSLVSALKHRNIVEMIGCCVNPLCAVMEFVSGGSLYSALQDAGAAPTLQTNRSLRLRMMLDIALGLRVLHKNSPPIVHCDLKSPNVLVTRSIKAADEDPLTRLSAICKITDFGESKHRTTAFRGRGQLHNPRWLAPEIISGKPFDEGADIFSLGIVFWEIMNPGDLPYDEYTSVQKSNQALEDEIMKGLRPSLKEGMDPVVKSIITHCFASNSTDRPSVSTIITSLMAALQDDDQEAYVLYSKLCKSTTDRRDSLRQPVDNATPGRTAMKVRQSLFHNCGLLRPSAAAVTSMAPILSPSLDGGSGKLYMWVTHADGMLSVWSLSTRCFGKLVLNASLPSTGTCICSSPMGMVWIGHENGMVSVLDSRTLSQIESFTAHSHNVTLFITHGAYIWSASRDKTVKVWASKKEASGEFLREMASKMMDKKNGVVVKDRTYHLRVYKECFLGNEAVDWLLLHTHITEREAAGATLNEMMNKNLIKHVADYPTFRDGKFFYRFIDIVKVDDSVDAGPSFVPDDELRKHGGSLDAFVVSMAVAMSDPKTGVKVEDRKWHLKRYKSCFIASEAVVWLQKHYKFLTTSAAVNVCNLLVLKGVIQHCAVAQPFYNTYLFFRFNLKALSEATSRTHTANRHEKLYQLPGTVTGGFVLDFDKILLAADSTLVTLSITNWGLPPETTPSPHKGTITAFQSLNRQQFITGCTRGIVAQWSKDKLTCIKTFDFTFAVRCITSFTPDTPETVWIVGTEHKVLELNAKTLTVITDFDSDFYDNTVAHGIVYSAGGNKCHTLWVGGTNGLCTFLEKGTVSTVEYAENIVFTSPTTTNF